jgi:inner membrane protein
MLILGHTGITLGITLLLKNAIHGDYAEVNTDTQRRADHLEASAEQSDSDNGRASRIASLISHLDLRVILIGSLLPDIIDKPVGQYLFRETFSNGRIFSHTLLFLILLSLGGLYVYRSRGRSWLLALAFGTFTHLVFDQMWSMPATLFWPIYGLTFYRLDTTEWIPSILHSLLTDPRIYGPELVGAAILLWFVLALVRRRQVGYFLRWGKIQ